MKLTDLLKENENPNRMESADDIIDKLNIDYKFIKFTDDIYELYM